MLVILTCKPELGGYAVMRQRAEADGEPGVDSYDSTKEEEERNEINAEPPAGMGCGNPAEIAGPRVSAVRPALTHRRTKAETSSTTREPRPPSCTW